MALWVMPGMHIIVLAVLGSYVIMKRPVKWRGLIRYGVICAVLTVVAVGEKSRVKAIQARGFLRVGYLPDRLPFVYKNTASEIVGYDAEMARLLAQDLNVELEFVKLENRTVLEALDEGLCDLVMSGLVVTVDRLLDLEFTQAYMDQTVALLVPDHQVEAFNSAEKLAQMEHPRIGIPDDPFLADKVATILPNAEIEVIESPRPYLRGLHPDLDAVLISAEAGSAWCLIYSNYSVVVPMPWIIKAPTAYTVARKDKEFAAFVSNWIELKDRDGQLQRLFDHWITGAGVKDKTPRWCIARDVLGWGADSTEDE